MKPPLSAWLLALVGLSGCDVGIRHSRCDNQLLARSESPDKQFVAMSYHRSCANRSGLYTFVSVQAAAAVPPLLDQAEPVLTLAGHRQLGMSWTGPSSLEIWSPALTDPKTVLTRLDTWRCVQIQYRDH